MAVQQLRQVELDQLVAELLGGRRDLQCIVLGEGNKNLSGHQKYDALQAYFRGLESPKDREVAALSERPVDVSRSDLSGLVAVGLRLRHLKGVETYFVEADLTGADLMRANLTSADLTGADLTGAYLLGARLIGAKLAGAVLKEAKFGWAKFERADLTGADVTGADFREASLIETQLAGVRGLEYALFHGTVVSEVQRELILSMSSTAAYHQFSIR